MWCAKAVIVCWCMVHTVIGTKLTYYERGPTEYDNMIRLGGKNLTVRSLPDCGKECAIDGLCSGFSYSAHLRLCQLHNVSVAISAMSFTGLATMKFYVNSNANLTAILTTTTTAASTTATTPTITTIGTPTTTASSTTATAQTIATTTTTAQANTTTAQTTTTQSTPTTTTGQCPTPETETIMELPGGAQYQIAISVTPRKRNDSASYCISAFNLDFAMIDSADEMEAVQDILLSCPGYNGSDYWIDGFKGSAGWKYTDGVDMPINDTVFWMTGSPGSQGACVLMRGSANYRWDNEKCGIYDAGVICMTQTVYV